MLSIPHTTLLPVYQLSFFVRAGGGFESPKKQELERESTGESGTVSRNELHMMRFLVPSHTESASHWAEEARFHSIQCSFIPLSDLSLLFYLIVYAKPKLRSGRERNRVRVGELERKRLEWKTSHVSCPTAG